MIYLLDHFRNRADALRVTGHNGGCFAMDGLLIAGRGVHVEGALEGLDIRHCTLVPGWMLHSNCEPRRPAEPSLELYRTHARVRIEHSILGSIQVAGDEVQTDPLEIRLSNSILDATSLEREAVGAPGNRVAHAVLTLRNCTVLGKIETHAIALAENCIFQGAVLVARRQLGCLRFCFVSPGSRTPRRYACQPDGVDAAFGPHPNDAQEGLRRDERLRVRPQFNSTRYGASTYCQLSAACAPEITRGAEDEAEMGAFHDGFQAQREASLRAQLDAHLPAGMQAGIIFAN